MATITIPKKEYQQLLENALRYQYIRHLMEEDIFVSPPVRDIEKMVQKFKETNLYSQKFLNSLKRGLKRSSYFGK
ncbi:MAG: hypothetical protein WBC21_02840 [Minisyncoccales bacterium]